MGLEFIDGTQFWQSLLTKNIFLGRAFDFEAHLSLVCGGGGGILCKKIENGV